MHIVQLIVRVDGGDDGGAGKHLDQHTGQIGLGAVAVDDVGPCLAGILDQPQIVHGDIARVEGLGADAHGGCIFGKFAVAQADQGQVAGLLEARAEGQDVGLGAALVAAAGDMHKFHSRYLHSGAIGP